MEQNYKYMRIISYILKYDEYYLKAISIYPMTSQVWLTSWINIQLLFQADSIISSVFSV